MPPIHDSSLTPNQRSFLDTRPFSADFLFSLFRDADQLEHKSLQFGQFYDPQFGKSQKVIFCLFLEPSTRTRLSFEMAAYRLGHQVAVMDVGSGSSRVKGETDVDTVLNVVAMNPDALVIRYNRSPELDRLLPTLSVPIISGGNASAAHPTQALLDGYTIFRERGRPQDLRGERVLIVGDILHSRVARSNFDVLSKLGAEIGICGPSHLLPKADEVPNVRIFENLDDAITWPTVYMGLRVQLERHEPGEVGGALQAINEKFGLTPARLGRLSKNSIIMHPGPINHGVEFSPEVIHDSRSRVLTQVSNGVLVRAALLQRLLNQKAGEA